MYILAGGRGRSLIVLDDGGSKEIITSSDMKFNESVIVCAMCSSL